MELTPDDLKTLWRMRLERIWRLIKLPPNETIIAIRDGELSIYGDRVASDALLKNRRLDQICHAACASRISMWVQTKRVWQYTLPLSVPMDIDLESDLNAIGENLMATATLERTETKVEAKAPSAAKNGRSANSGTFEEVLKQVQKVTQQSDDAIGALILEAVPQTDWRYNQGRFVLPTSAVKDSLDLMRQKLETAIAKMGTTEAIEEVAPEINGIEKPAAKPTPKRMTPKTARKPAAKKPAAKNPAA